MSKFIYYFNLLYLLYYYYYYIDACTHVEKIYACVNMEYIRSGYKVLGLSLPKIKKLLYLQYYHLFFNVYSF